MSTHQTNPQHSLTSDIGNVGKWYDQDLVMANIFLYLKPMELFLPDESCLMVCKSWNQLISGPEFAKYYFENSFCVSSPFFNDQNQHEFDELDSIKFNLEEAIADQLEEMENSEEEEEEIEENVKPMEIPTRVKCFEDELGYKTKLVWKNNFYTKFLILAALMEKQSASSSTKCLDLSHSNEDATPLCERIENLLKPLNPSQIGKLNSILKKLKFSKLLSSSIKTKSGSIVIFNDYGLPNILSFRTVGIFICHTFALYAIAKPLKNLSHIYLPPFTTLKEEKTFSDALCGLFPSAVERYKKSMLKSPLTAYMLFSREKRKQVIAEEPSLTMMEVAKKIGNYWRESSDKEKQPFIEESQKLKEEYQREFNTFEFIISGLN